MLDTHIWHWWVNQISGKLSSDILDLIAETEVVAVSAISCFEMAWLVKHGRIEMNLAFDEWLAEVEKDSGSEILPVTAQIATKAVHLPEHHKDPQDRIIIATALQYQAKLLSFDSVFSSSRVGWFFDKQITHNYHLDKPPSNHCSLTFFLLWVVGYGFRQTFQQRPSDYS